MATKKYRAVPKKEEPSFLFRKNRKYQTIAFYALGVAAAAVVLVFFFLNYGNFGSYLKTVYNVLKPVLLGVLFAYLINPLLRLYETKVFSFVGKKSGKLRIRRILSVIVTYLTLLIIIVGFIWILVPQIVSGYKDLSMNLSNYIATLQNWLNSLARESKYLAEPMSKAAEYINSVLDDIYGIIEKIIPSITSAVSGVVVAVKNSLLGIILSVYFLLVKEQLGAQCKKALCSLMKPEKYDRFLVTARDADERFGKYITGKILDSVIIGLLTFFCTAVFSMPYYPLISLIVGVTNIIPVFGPIIGGIIGAFIVFIANPIDALWFALIVFLIQQLDGNYIGPKILGSATGLEPVWVMVAITVMSGFFGFMGMLLGVPLFAVVYYLVKRNVEGRLTRRGYACETSAYLTTETGKQLYIERTAPKKTRSKKEVKALISDGKEKLSSLREKKKKKALPLPAEDLSEFEPAFDKTEPENSDVCEAPSSENRENSES